VLLAASGTGGLIGAILISIYGRYSQYKRYYLWGSILLSVCILLFAFSTNFYTSLALLIVGGFGLAGFGTMQVALLLVETPAHLRARILGLLTVCIGMGPVGVLHIGYMAEKFGMVVGLVTVGLEGALLLLATAVIWPELRKA
jgi:MFS family permease